MKRHFLIPFATSVALWATGPLHAEDSIPLSKAALAVRALDACAAKLLPRGYYDLDWRADYTAGSELEDEHLKWLNISAKRDEVTEQGEFSTQIGMRQRGREIVFDATTRQRSYANTPSIILPGSFEAAKAMAFRAQEKCVAPPAGQRRRACIADKLGEENAAVSGMAVWVNSPMEGLDDYYVKEPDGPGYTFSFSSSNIIVDWQSAVTFTMDGIEDGSMETVLKLGLNFPQHVVSGLRTFNSCAAKAQPDFAAAASQISAFDPKPMRLGFEYRSKGNLRLITDMAQVKDPSRFGQTAAAVSMNGPR